jgi:Nuclease-related domain
VKVHLAIALYLGGLTERYCDMDVAGARTRSEAFKRIRKMVLAPQIVLVEIGVVALFGVLVVGTPLLFRHFGFSSVPRLVDFIWGFEIAFFLFALVGIAIVFTGSGQYLVGYSAERWTGKVLNELGPRWRLFHGVPFSSGFYRGAYVVDVDHIAVGPYGVLVVETKYSSALLDLSALRLDKRVQDAISQVGDNAARVRALLNQELPGISLRPVVIYWGRWVTGPKHCVRLVDGKAENVRLVHGGEASTWMPLLNVKDGSGLTDAAIEMAAAKIEKYQLSQRIDHSES